MSQEEVVIVEDNFVTPHFIAELGEEGLTLHEIAKSLGKEPRHVKEVFERLQVAGFIEGAQACTFNNINGVAVSTQALVTEEAKLLVTQSNTKEGILYCKFLIKCEKKLKEIVIDPMAIFEGMKPEALDFFSKQMAEKAEVIRVLVKTKEIQQHQEKALTTSMQRNGVLTKENKKLKEELKDWVNPTEVGVALAVSAREANKRLCAAGLQHKKGIEWELTEEGHKVGKYSEFETAAYKSRRILWDRKTVLKALLSV